LVCRQSDKHHLKFTHAFVKSKFEHEGVNLTISTSIKKKTFKQKIYFYYRLFIVLVCLF